MRKFFGTFCMTAGALLVAGALLLYLYNTHQVSEQKEWIEWGLAEIENTSDVTYVDGIAVKEIDGYQYCGIVSIPALNIELPVLNECTEDSLAIAPGRLWGMPVLRNLLLGGHNNEAQFWNLQSLVPGDEIVFEDFNGHVWRYEMVTSETLWPSQTIELAYSDYDLSLFNCTWNNAQRYIVRANLISTEE